LRKECTCRENVAVGQKNIQYPALVEADKILLPSLHIKLGLMKNFVKAMDWTSPAVSNTCMKNSLGSVKQRLKRGSW